MWYLNVCLGYQLLKGPLENFYFFGNVMDDACKSFQDTFYMIV